VRRAIGLLLLLLAFDDAPRIRVDQLEHRVFDLINVQRREAKLPALRWDERLMRIARAHSDDMVKRRFFDHVNPDGDDPTARGRHAGYNCRKVMGGGSFREGLAENLADEPRFSRLSISSGRRTYDWNTSDAIAREAVEGWMRSPGHRRNILDRNYEQTAVGIGVSAEHVFLTQLFC